MSEFCRHFLIERTCLLRQLARGASASDEQECNHCQATVAELAQHRVFAKHVANELEDLMISEPSCKRATQLARDVWERRAAE